METVSHAVSKTGNYSTCHLSKSGKMLTILTWNLNNFGTTYFFKTEPVYKNIKKKDCKTFCTKSIFRDYENGHFIAWSGNDFPIGQYYLGESPIACSGKSRPLIKALFKF